MLNLMQDSSLRFRPRDTVDRHRMRSLKTLDCVARGGTEMTVWRQCSAVGIDRSEFVKVSLQVANRVTGHACTKAGRPLDVVASARLPNRCKSRAYVGVG